MRPLAHLARAPDRRPHARLGGNLGTDLRPSEFPIILVVGDDARGGVVHRAFHRINAHLLAAFDDEIATLLPTVGRTGHIILRLVVASVTHFIIPDHRVGLPRAVEVLGPRWRSGDGCLRVDHHVRAIQEDGVARAAIVVVEGDRKSRDFSRGVDAETSARDVDIGPTTVVARSRHDGGVHAIDPDRIGAGVAGFDRILDEKIDR